MFDLDTIIARNKEAARRGVPTANKLTGAEGVVPEPVVVVDNRTNKVIDTLTTEWDACTKYRQEQKDGVVRILFQSEAFRS